LPAIKKIYLKLGTAASKTLVTFFLQLALPKSANLFTLIINVGELHECMAGFGL